MTECEMKKVSAWIPQETLTKLEEKGYQNRAEAIRLGLERLLEDSTGNPMESTQEDKRNPMEYIGNPMEYIGNPVEYIGNPVESNGIHDEILKARNEEYQRDITGYKENVKILNVEIARLKEALSNAPDPIELTEARTRSEGLQRLTEEKDKRIEALEREVSRLDMFAHYFKNVEVKQIEAPAAEKVKPWWKFW